MIPYNTKAIQNANYQLNDMRNLEVAETEFESTAVVFSYGKDLFWFKLQPDKTFDMLNDDFNYILLGAIVVAVTVIFFF